MVSTPEHRGRDNQKALVLRVLLHIHSKTPYAYSPHLSNRLNERAV